MESKNQTEVVVIICKSMMSHPVSRDALLFPT